MDEKGEEAMARRRAGTAVGVSVVRLSVHALLPRETRSIVCFVALQARVRFAPLSRWGEEEEESPS